MKKKTLTIIPILFYSSFSLASLYVHQPVQERESSKTSNLRILYEDDAKKTYDRKEEQKRDISKENMLVKNISENKNKGKESFISEEYIESSNTNLNTNSNTINNNIIDTQDEIFPDEKTIYAKMDKGYLSNSMREHLETLGWELRWTSGSDREISVPYVVEHKDVVGFITEISRLYDIFIDIYPDNKTVHVSK